MIIDEILAAPKRIIRKKRITLTQEHRHWRAELPLECDSLPYKMTMFIRKLVRFEEDFSIGLRLDQAHEPFNFAVVLVRFQGPHGGQSATHSGQDLHNEYHIHLYSDEDLQRRRKNASYRESSGFNSYEQALMDFLSYCNIEDPYDIFDEERQRCAQVQMPLDIPSAWED